MTCVAFEITHVIYHHYQGVIMTDLMLSLDFYFIKRHSNTLDQVISNSNKTVDFLKKLKGSQGLEPKHIVAAIDIIKKTDTLTSDLTEENKHFVKKLQGVKNEQSME